jgi:hypothetical protein
MKINFFSTVIRFIKVIKLWLTLFPKMIGNQSICGSGNVHFIGDGFLTTRPVGNFTKKTVESYEKGVFTDTPSHLHRYNYTIFRFQAYNWAVSNALQLEGDLVEIGVWWGILSYASIEYHESKLNNKRFHLVDAFGKLDNDSIDEHMSNMPYISNRSNSKYEEDIFDKVKDRFRGKPVCFHRGYVPEILETDKGIPDKICFLSLDLNNSEAERKSIEFLWDRIVKGGYIYLDDYGCQGHEDTRLMYDNFFEDKGCNILITPFSSALVVKI